MAQSINVLVYQVGSNKLGTPQNMIIPVANIRGTPIGLSPAANGNNAGSTGQGVFPGLEYKVYSAIPVVNPSNAGMTDYFTNSSVTSIQNAINA
jgi:hypothetical protein